MRYFLPPAEPSRSRREIPRVSALGAIENATDPALDRDHAHDGSGHLVRVRRIDPGTGDDYLDRWAADAPGATSIPARPGVRAVERSRADTTLGVGPGGPVVRRQRLAVAEGATVALAAHWSVIEPVRAEDERTWERLLDRVQGEIAGQRGWTA